MKVLIVDCLGQGSIGRRATLDVIGAGPRVVAGILEDYGYEVKLALPFTLPRRLECFSALLISAMISDIGSVKECIGKWRRNVGRRPVIVGGPITANPKILRELDADILVLGEGEDTLRKLIQINAIEEGVEAKGIEKIEGIAYKVEGKIIVSERKSYIPREELNSYKPSTDIITEYPHYKIARVYVEVVRGCSNFYRTSLTLANGRKCIGCGKCYRGKLRERIHCPLNIPPGCAYCSVPSLYGYARSKDMEVILDEIKELVKLGVRRIVLSAPDFLDYGRDYLVDPEPLTDPRNPQPNLDAISQLLSEILDLREFRKGSAILMIENVKPNLVNEDVARLLGKYLKGTPVHIGCEVADNDLLRKLARPNTLEDVERAIKLLVKYGLRPYVYFMHGLPGENLRIARKTAKFMRKLFRLGVEKITVYRFTPLPKSALESYPKPPPAIKHLPSRIIVEEARKINILAKRRFLGRRIEAIIGGEYWDRKHLVAYPMNHGPVILVDKGENANINSVVIVEVKKIISDRLLKGDIVRVVKKLNNTLK